MCHETFHIVVTLRKALRLSNITLTYSQISKGPFGSRPAYRYTDILKISRLILFYALRALAIRGLSHRCPTSTTDLRFVKVFKLIAIFSVPVLVEAYSFTDIGIAHYGRCSFRIRHAPLQVLESLSNALNLCGD